MPLTCSLFRSVLYVKKSVLGSQYFYLGKILGFASTTMDIKKTTRTADECLCAYELYNLGN